MINRTNHKTPFESNWLLVDHDMATSKLRNFPEMMPQNST